MASQPQSYLEKKQLMEQEHRLYNQTTHRKRPWNMNLTSFLVYLIHCAHHRHITPTMALNPLQVHLLARRQYPKSIGLIWRKTWSGSENVQKKSRLQTSPLVSFSSIPKAVSASHLFGSNLSSPQEDSQKRTQYTIDDSVCLPTKKETLEKAVQKACRSLEIYMEKRPIAAHTRCAFETLVGMIEEETRTYDGIVLDSGCGTGRSTKLLASTIHPNHLVIGVDRSFARLTKTKDNQKGIDDDAFEDAAYCYLVSENAYLVRAELVDFWRCCIEHGWTSATSEPSGTRSENKFGDDNDNQYRAPSNSLKITHHYMLYPNPYPTNARISSRWYAHPSFPLILKLGIQTMILRSNWQGYLSEFAKSVEIANEFYIGRSNPNSGEGNPDAHEKRSGDSMENLALPYVDSIKDGPTERIDKSVALTNFESKYDNVGESTYQLVLERSDTVKK